MLVYYLALFIYTSPLPIPSPSSGLGFGRLIRMLVGNKRSERKELARRAAFIQRGESAFGEKGIQMETFSGETLRRWTWGGVQAF